MRSPVLALACGLGAGLSPVAPGTVGTLVALPCWWLLSGLSPVLYLTIVACAFALGVWISARAAVALGEHDPAAIVIDEIVAYLLVLTVVPATLWALCFSFVLFRALDVLKPWPIGWVDRQVPGGLGIMLDDVVAGVYTALLVIAARALGLFA